MTDLVTVDLNQFEISSIVKALQFAGADRDFKQSMQVYNDPQISKAARNVYRRFIDLSVRQSNRQRVFESDALRQQGRDTQEETIKKLSELGVENKEMRIAALRLSEELESIASSNALIPSSISEKIQKISDQLRYI